jgi:hypothetical protein
MPRDAQGNIIPGSYNPDGSINRTALQQYQQRALANPGAAIRSPVATARLTAPPTNASPNAMMVVRNQMMAQRAAQAAAAQAAGGRQPLRTGAPGASLRGDVNQATAAARPGADLMTPEQARPAMQPPQLKARQAGLRPPMGLGTAITR